MKIWWGEVRRSKTSGNTQDIFIHNIQNTTKHKIILFFSKFYN